MINRIKLLTFTAMISLMSLAQAEVTHIDHQKVQSLMKAGVPLIDVRTQSEWKQTGIIEGSHLLTLFDETGKVDIEKWVADLDKIAGKDKPFMLICAVGGRTGMLAQYLDTRAGYSQVHNVQRGIHHWISANKPVVDYSEKDAED